MDDEVFRAEDSRPKPPETHREILKGRSNGRREISREVKRQAKGYAQLTRYADDFIVCFEYEEDAKGFGERLRQRLGKFGLKVSEEKSRIIEFGRKTWQRGQ